MSFMTASAGDLSTAQAGRTCTTFWSIAPKIDWPCRVEHLDADVVAELHERCHGLAAVDRLAHAPLGDAGAADRGVAVGDRARADDGAGLEVPRLGRMGDQLAEVEGQVGRRRWDGRTPCR